MANYDTRRFRATLPGERGEGWARALMDGTNYNYTASSVIQSHVPSDAILDWSDDICLSQTASVFLRAYYTNAGVTTRDPETQSYFFGVNTPRDPNGRRQYDYAVTLPQGETPSVYRVALSFIFKTKIHSRSDLTEDEKWKLTQYIIIHELGHARGLNAEPEDYDHITHAGSDENICVMRPNASSNIPARYVFCGYHKRVLRECLDIIRAQYNPNDRCATGQ